MERRTVHQTVPIVLELGSEHGTLHSMTRHMGPDHLAVELAPEDAIPPVGTRARFRVDVAGSAMAGDARVRGVKVEDTADGRLPRLDPALRRASSRRPAQPG